MQALVEFSRINNMKPESITKVRRMQQHCAWAVFNRVRVVVLRNSSPGRHQFMGG